LQKEASYYQVRGDYTEKLVALAKLVCYKRNRRSYGQGSTVEHSDAIANKWTFHLFGSSEPELTKYESGVGW